MFDAAVIQDALHHSDDEYPVIKNIYDAPVPGGVLVTIEPGVGHSTASYSLDAVAKFGTTEKDMPHRLQKKHMQRTIFTRVEQYPRAAARGVGLFYFLVEKIRLAGERPMPTRGPMRLATADAINACGRRSRNA
jgi:hypothetical protein